MEQPAFSDLNSDAAMALRVTAQGDHQDFRRQTVKLANRIKAEPRLATSGVGSPIADIIPLSGSIALIADERHLFAGGSLPLERENVDAGSRKVLDAAGMVEVEMGEHDVAHIAGGEAQRLNLPDGRVPLLQADIQDERPQPWQAAASPEDILKAVACVDENETLRCLDQKTVRGNIGIDALTGAIEEGAAERAVRPTVEMVNAHCLPRVSSGGRRDGFALDEGEEIGVEFIGVGRREAVAAALVDLERGVLQDLR